MAKKDLNLNTVGWSDCQGQFTSLAWDNFGVESNHPMGIVVGGTNEGSVVFWDVQQVIDQSTG